MSDLLIAGGRVIDPSSGRDGVGDVLIRDGRVAAVGEVGDTAGVQRTIDATGLIVCPGLIDMHVHLREPGGERAETIASGTAAAVAGGFTAVACIPNTNPAIDSPAMVEFVLNQAARADNCRVHVVACVSRGREGKQLSEIGRLVEAGAVAFSDDGDPVGDPELMRRALEYCRMFDKPVLNHCEVKELTRGGVMHEGLTSLKLGLPGMPAEAEEMMIDRDLSLAESTGGHIHIMHVSTADGVARIRRAKRRGVPVTTEICPHHFTLTDQELERFDADFKMSPPLRGPRHVEACLEGLADGTIDAICTDHAPHAPEKKMQELTLAPFGILGLETALGLCGLRLVAPGVLDWPAVIEKLTVAPAKILNLAAGTLAPGAAADVTIFDPDARWTVDRRRTRSLSQNTPFEGWELQGQARYTIVDGVVKFEDAPVAAA